MAVVQGDEREKPPAAAARGHPLLRGWRRDRYTHGMHPAQMEALRAMCGALIPSLPADGAHGRGDPPGGKDLERFYRASAADSTIPDEVTAEVYVRSISSVLGLLQYSRSNQSPSSCLSVVQPG
jgi:long-chain-alcohol oxidase